LLHYIKYIVDLYNYKLHCTSANIDLNFLSIVFVDRNSGHQITRSIFLKIMALGLLE